MAFRKFADHHDNLVELADAILDLAEDMSPESLDLLLVKRIELSRAVAAHCGEEIAHLQRHGFEKQTEPAKVALVRRYHSEILSWRGELMECNASWPTQRIASDPANFRAAFSVIARQLRDRVRWEEQEFYPAIFGAAITRTPAYAD